MPYIAKDRRRVLDAGGTPKTKGELNYVVTRAISGFCLEQGGPSYDVCADARIALLDAAAEFYRRVVAPYEDAKRAENGDVYPPQLLPLPSVVPDDGTGRRSGW